MKIAIVGFDTEGRATYDFFRNQGGHELTICDQQTDKVVPEGSQSILGEAYLDNLDRFDLIIRTAGMHPRKILDKNPAVGPKISTHVNEFFKASPTTNIIGITGTKGKGTTSTLTANMLDASGKHVRLGGNIGVPPLTFIDELTADSWVVLELSSFQLMDLQAAPHIAVCLMVVPEHLDWHTDLDEYFTAKEQLFARQVNGDVAIFYHDNANAKRIADAGQGQKVPYFYPPGAHIDALEDGDNIISIDGSEICKTSQLKLLGQHNWQNACAAITAVWYAFKEVVGPPEAPHVQAMRQVLTTFSGLEHRLEFVRELDGVRYYDDSFGTTPETAIVAMQAFRQPKVVVLGGSDKGAEYDELAQTVANGNVRHALLIGGQAARIQTALEQAGFTSFSAGGASMDDIVANARQQAQPGDIVLLSTACASFDMFKNYKDRGEQFKQAVLDLPAPSTNA